ncbi:MAG: PTS sugar transporter subunit IIA [Cardiobacteriaceae bacterium]|nr:PTS sugar transporter subunit IIA [Cardiobacteriaceae bacterium]
MNFKQSLMENQSVKLGARAADWREAIKIGTDLLVASDAVEPRYYDTIIRCVEELGSYIIIAPGLAMPHARPEDGVKRTAFALVTLAEPVMFPGEDTPVSLFITLAGSNADEHMQSLMEVTTILEDPDNEETGVDLDKILRCKTPEEVYAVIDAALGA